MFTNAAGSAYHGVSLANEFIIDSNVADTESDVSDAGVCSKAGGAGFCLDGAAVYATP
jgi:hypothetical protein